MDAEEKAGHAEDPVRGMHVVCAAIVGSIDITATIASSVVVVFVFVCGNCRLFLLLRRRQRDMSSGGVVGADGARAVLRYAR